MLLSLVVIYLPNLFSCQKSLSEPYYYVVAIAPLGGSSIPAQGSISIEQIETQPQADIAC
jgi:hypothetical protein